MGKTSYNRVGLVVAVGNNGTLFRAGGFTPSGDRSKNRTIGATYGFADKL